MNTLLQDLRFGLRMLAKSPGFTAVAVLTLALGIGANTAIFSVVNTVLLRPLPYRDPDRLVMLWEAEPKEAQKRGLVSYPNFQDWLRQNQVFLSMAVIGYHGGALTAESGAIRLRGAAVSSSFFPLLGIKPLLGRSFVAEEDEGGSERVVILTYGFWQSQFGGDAGIVGKQITLDTDLYTVVGVLPPDFRPFDGALKDAAYLTSLSPLAQMMSQRGCVVFEAIARLKPEVSLARAQSEMSAIYTRLAKEYPENSDRKIAVIGLQEQMVEGIRAALWVLLAVVGFVLLIVCANLANLLLTKADLPGQQYATLQSRQSFWSEVIRKTEALPGVKSVGATGGFPFRGSLTTGFQPLDGGSSAPNEIRAARFQAVSAGYFQTMGASLVRGRFFEARDMTASNGKIIINETMAERFWRDEDPIGKHLKISMSFGEKSEPESYEIVGITHDMKQDAIEAEVRPEMSVPYTQLSFWDMTFTVKTAVAPKSLVGAVRKVVADLDPGAPVSDVRTLNDWISDSLARRRFLMVMLGAFSLLALFLAGIGVYGVMAYAVSVRQQEIGIRMALGAQRDDVLNLVVRQGMRLTVQGVALGLVGAVALTRVLAHLLFGVTPRDPVTFAGVTLLLGTVAFLACYLPARRATKVDPMVALRCE